MFATTPSLAVGLPAHATVAVIASPAGPYFASGVTGIRLWVSTDYTRAAVGGTGAAKCGGNYAAGLAARVQAQQHGCDQVLYVDGAEHRWLEESGTMNLVLVTGRRAHHPGSGHHPGGRHPGQRPGARRRARPVAGRAAGGPG